MIGPTGNYFAPIESVTVLSTSETATRDHKLVPIPNHHKFSLFPIVGHCENNKLTGPGFKRNPDRECPVNGRSSFPPMGGLSTTDRRLKIEGKSSICRACDYLQRISILMTSLKTRVFEWSKNAYFALSIWWIFDLLIIVMVCCMVYQLHINVFRTVLPTYLFPFSVLLYNSYYFVFLALVACLFQNWI